MYQDTSWHGVHSLARQNTVTLDALLRDAAGDVDFVKMDAQGAEWDILRGAGRLLGQAHARVLMELWPFGIHGLGGSVSALVETLLASGFSAWTMEKSRELVPIGAREIEERGAALGTWSSFNLLWVK